MTAIECLRIELDKIQKAQCECITEHGVIKPYDQMRYKILVRQAHELKGAIDWLTAVYKNNQFEEVNYSKPMEV